MAKRSKNNLTFFGNLAIVLIGILFPLIGKSGQDFGSLQKDHPPDSSLRAVFMKRRSEFNRLVTMSNQDKHVVRITKDFT